MSAQETTLIFNIYGPVVIGSLTNVFGLGIFSLQAIIYFDRYPNASRAIKSLVLFVLLLNVGQTISNCIITLKLTAVHALDFVYYRRLYTRVPLLQLLDIHARPEDLVALLLTLIINTIAQIFLVRRCLQFENVTRNPATRKSATRQIERWALTILLGGLVTLNVGSALGTQVLYWQQNSPNDLVRGTAEGDRFHTLALLWLVSCLVLDICLCVLIIWQLRSATRDAQDTSRLVSYLTRLIFQSGVAVSAMQLAALIAYLKMIDSAWADFPISFSAKVYSITLVASLSNPYKRTTHSCEHIHPPMEEPGGEISTGACDGSWQNTDANTNDREIGRDHNHSYSFGYPLLIAQGMNTNSGFSRPAQEYRFSNSPNVPQSALSRSQTHVHEYDLKMVDPSHGSEMEENKAMPTRSDDHLFISGEKDQSYVQRQPHGSGRKRSKSLDANDLV